MEPILKHSEYNFGTVILKHGVNDEIISKVKKINPSRVIFSNGSWRDIEFLAELSATINHIEIGDDNFDWSILPRIKSLEKLTIGGWFNCDIDFHKLKSLKFLDTYWNDGYDDRFFEMKTLRALKVEGFKQQNMVNISKLKNLEFLSLTYSRNLESLDGIDNLEKLRRLYLLNCARLENINSISSLNMESLRIESCKRFKKIRPITKMQSLKELNIFDCDEIENFSQLVDLQSLKWFIFNNKLTDGDLAFIYNLKNLDRCEFNNKRNYSVKAQDIKSYLEEKGKFKLDRFSDWYAWGILSDFPDPL